MAVHGIIGIITFIETWFNVPANPIPTLEEQRIEAATKKHREDKIANSPSNNGQSRDLD